MNRSMIDAVLIRTVLSALVGVQIIHSAVGKGDLACVVPFREQKALILSVFCRGIGIIGVALSEQVDAERRNGHLSVTRVFYDDLGLALRAEVLLDEFVGTVVEVEADGKGKLKRLLFRLTINILRAWSAFRSPTEATKRLSSVAKILRNKSIFLLSFQLTNRLRCRLSFFPAKLKEQIHMRSMNAGICTNAGIR